ncbi:hypothetical protein [Frankia sp. CcI49]|uniref:hypothetical protein n=1 Tax=Frankia sp. CcI49 TaxID=1745382 RepID=UPI00130448AF|nr:hypothetical protein [Frankia sp. CcI49]
MDVTAAAPDDLGRFLDLGAVAGGEGVQVVLDVSRILVRISPTAPSSTTTAPGPTVSP